MPNEHKTPRCSVIVPVFCGGVHFQSCLRAIAAALRPGDELIVIANGEGDGAWRLAEKSGARVLPLPSNRGPAHARNAGAQIATGELLFFIDADVTVPPDCIQQIVATFAADPELTALIGSYDDAPNETNFHSQYKNLFHHYVHQHGSTDAFTFWGACGAIRRRPFLEIGGFDESYARSSIEDIELGYRLRAAGHRIRLARDLQVKHWKRWTAHTLLRSDLIDRASPWTQLILEQWRARRAVPNDLNLKLAYKLSLLASFLFLGTLAATLLTPWAILLAALFVAVFLFLNLPLFRFFLAHRGAGFCARAVTWRFLYDLCCGLGFCLGVATFITRLCFGKIARKQITNPRRAETLPA